MTSPATLPLELPVPEDDGACNHLPGMPLADLELVTTHQTSVNFAAINGDLVIYIYPMTGRPNVALPDGWAQIPGAMGCTPQACAFRDHYQELCKLKATVYGLSTQTTEYQSEAASRLQLPFALASDSELKFINSLSLPTMQSNGQTLAKRVTLVAHDGVIQKVFYPVFPPAENADQVIDYLRNKNNSQGTSV
ncbi:MAG: peroxiredoxin [Gammaproteobacteria bacterium]|nr:peroxiredoxin [Gammaproteobacteria bacterium]MBL6999578.1 peroxiredoxin [Gammaproteobacteria bacterium]